MVKLGKIDYDELDIQIFSSIASVPNRSGRPVQVLSNVAWPESAGLVKPDPRLAVPTYRPYRLFPGCLIGDGVTPSWYVKLGHTCRCEQGY